MTRAFAISCLLILQAGCIHVPVDELGPSFETVKLIRSAKFAPVALGDFSTSLTQSRFAKRINIRGSTMRPPNGMDFPSFLRETMMAELVAAGRFDNNSTVSISAEMTKNAAGEDISKGYAQIAATFTITQGGIPVFSRSYEVENHWKSDYIGAIAIPEAFQQYNELYGQIVRRALSDPEFVAALSR